MKFASFFLVLTLLSTALTSTYAQDDPIWVQRYDGSGGLHDYAKAITVDNAGAVIVVGKAWSDQGNYDPLIMKYSPDGVLQWSDAHDGGTNADDSAMSVAVSLQGDIYVGCISPSTAGNMDYLLIKYSPVGDVVWTRRYDNGSNDRIAEVATDIFGNVLVAGSSVGGYGWDYTIIKYSSSGAQLWVQRYNGYGGLADYAYALDVDREGNVYVTGSSWVRSNFFNHQSIGTVKYSSDGAYQWVAHRWVYDPCAGLDVTSDNAGNVYVVGYEGSFSGYQKQNYVTLKYSPAGAGVWTRLYNGPASSYDYGRKIAIDLNGNVFVTGESYASGSYYDMMTLAYSTDGTILGSHRYDGPISDNDYASDIVYIGPDRVLVIGTSPGDGTSSDIVSILYDSECNIYDTWPRRFNGEANLADRGVAVTAYESNAYVAGTSDGGATFYDVVTLKYDTPEPIEPPLIHLTDADFNPIPEGKEFRIYKVENDPPTLSEEHLGSLTTDVTGTLTLPPEWFSPGDWIKIERRVHTVSSVRHQITLPTMYTIVIDNADFNTTSGAVTYDAFEGVPEQTIQVNHPVALYNLLVSVEWDAELEYLQSLQDNFGMVSNYLYDVTDGQLRLDSVKIYDDKEKWTEPDFRICADNSLTPHCANLVGVGSIRIPGVAPIKMPRKSFGPDRDIVNGILFPALTGRNASYIYDLDLTVGDDNRTKAHEFGHYALGFWDEYLFYDLEWPNPFPLFKGERCESAPPSIGFMDQQYRVQGYELEPFASEMSSGYRYTDEDCQNTWQWVLNGSSCWDEFRDDFDDSYDDILVRFKRPEDQILPEGYDYFEGPNNDLANLNYDVGALIVFPVAAEPTDARTVDVTVLGLSSEDDPAEVYLKKGTGLFADKIYQGETATWPEDNLGKIKVLGYRDEYEITASGYVTSITDDQSQIPHRVWHCGTAQVESGLTDLSEGAAADLASDYLILDLQPVHGEYPVICTAELFSEGMEYKLVGETPFPSPPVADLFADDDTASTHMFTELGGDYVASVDRNLTSGGSIINWAQDDLYNPYFFRTEYSHYTLSQGVSQPFVSRCATGEFYLDTTETFDNALILSSPYPVIDNGLSVDAVNVGKVHCLAVYPAGSLSADNFVCISYDDSQFDLVGGIQADESTLDVYRWNNASTQWEPLGGSVDTLANSVCAVAPGEGVYAAFTTDVMTALGEETHTVLPREFSLDQNYPNPFNPVTEFGFALPTACHAKLEIFNIVGQRVNTLVDRQMKAGYHRVSWDGTKFASGVYMYRLQAGEYLESKKMLLLK